MKLISIEPTPNPNSMKLTLDERLPDGVRLTYTAESAPQGNELIVRLLAIEGVSSLFHTADFIALQRHPGADWRAILREVDVVFDSADPMSQPAVDVSIDELTEVVVTLQMFRGLPLLIRLSWGNEQRRVALPDRFTAAHKEAMSASKNPLLERQWVEQERRYGEPDDIGERIVREISAVYATRKLARLVEAARRDDWETAGDTEEPADLNSDDWQQRFAALKQMKPGEDTLPEIIRLSDDTHMSVRRLAIVYLGLVRDERSLEPLCKALEDERVAVRRTAGDSLTDLGDPRAMPAMIKCLEDSNKLVRWRAARFLYELGDERALPALRAAADDPEFEVSLQARQAIERIEGGGTAEGPVWQKLLRHKPGE